MKNLSFLRAGLFWATFCYTVLLVFAPFIPRLWGIVPSIMAVTGAIYYFSTRRLPSVSLKDMSRESKGISVYFLLVLLYMGLSYFWSVAPEYSFERTLKLTGLVLTAFLLFQLSRVFLTEQDNKFTFLHILGFCSGLVLLAYEAFSNLQITSLFIDGNFRFSRLNWGAAILSIAVWPAIYIVYRHGQKKRAIFLYIATVAILFTTNSQASQLGICAAGISFLLIYYFHDHMLKLYFALISFALFGAPFLYPLLAAWWPESLSEHVRSATTVRIGIWEEFSYYVADKPIIGHGLETSRFADMNKGDNPYNPYYETVLHPHSTILQIWYELGFIGVLFLWIALAFVFYQIIDMKSASDKAVTTALIIAMGSISLVGYGAWQGWLMGTYLLCGLVLILTIKNQRQSTLFVSNEPRPHL